MKKVLFALAIITLFSCGKKEETIKNTFETIKENVKEMNSETLLTMMDEDSKKYFSSMDNLLKNKSEYKLTALGEKYNCELMTRLLYQILEDPDSATMDMYSMESIVTMTQFIGMGILNSSNLDRFYFKEVESVKNDKATAVIRIRTQPNSNTFITTKYIFKKEGDTWKINVPSTFGFDEKIMNMQWRKSGAAAQTFIDEYIQSNGKQEDVQFQYRR